MLNILNITIYMTNNTDKYVENTVRGIYDIDIAKRQLSLDNTERSRNHRQK